MMESTSVEARRVRAAKIGKAIWKRLQRLQGEDIADVDIRAMADSPGRVLNEITNQETDEYE